MNAEAIRQALDRLDVIRKKLTMQGKGKRGNIGGEAAYADAYAVLCRLDPARYRSLRKKYR